MIKPSLKFYGGTELVNALNTLTNRVSKNVMREALTDAAEPMRRTMGQKAPREAGKPDLADHMVISPVRLKGADNSQASAVAVGPAQGFRYGFYQEYGTVHHSAQPFMRPAFDEGIVRAMAQLRLSIWTVLAARGIGQAASAPSAVQSEGRFL